MTSSTVSILSTQVKGNYEYCAHDFGHICLHLHHYDNYMHRKDRWEEGREGFSSEIAAEERGIGGEERRWEEEEEEEEERQAGRQGAYSGKCSHCSASPTLHCYGPTLVTSTRRCCQSRRMRSLQRLTSHVFDPAHDRYDCCAVHVFGSQFR